MPRCQGYFHPWFWQLKIIMQYRTSIHLHEQKTMIKSHIYNLIQYTHSHTSHTCLTHSPLCFVVIPWEQEYVDYHSSVNHDANLKWKIKKFTNCCIYWYFTDASFRDILSIATSVYGYFFKKMCTYFKNDIIYLYFTGILLVIH